MSDNFNELTPAQTERFAILAEEMGEALHIVGKILRHGLYSHDPIEGNEYKTNLYLLSVELGDIFHAIGMLRDANDIDYACVKLRELAREQKIAPYLHHQLLKSKDR